MENVKNIAAVVGCISACIALIVTIFKPIRMNVVNYFGRKVNESKFNREHKQLLSQMAEMTSELPILNQIPILIEQNKNMQNDIQLLIERVDNLQDKVLLNESDRLKSELFACGNQCRRGMVLHPEEFDHIREVYKKYNEDLGQNHSGTIEFEYIYNYYNSQKLD